MAAWAQDPELLATFRAEVQERLASLQTGLLTLEGHPNPRQAVHGPFRDAHTVKGSARMMGLTDVLAVAHGMEDLLGLLREGRVPARTDLVDLLLACCDAIGRALRPGGAELTPYVEALTRAAAGDDPVAPPVPEPAAQPVPDPVPEPVAQPAPEPAAVPAQRVAADPPQESVRVAAGRVYDLLDAVGEAGLGGRRVEQTAVGLLALAEEQARWLTAVRAATARTPLAPELELALHRLTDAGEQLTGRVRGLRELVEDSRGALEQVRDTSMGLATVPVQRVLGALPRLVRDVASATGKDVGLVLVGEHVELDKQVLDGIADALKHLVINAVDHGCGTPAQRRAAGRPERCTVTVSARSVGGTVVIEVADDGSGIDEAAVRARAVSLGLLPADSTASGAALLPVLLRPGFSTAPAVTRTSGRGVGLDVVAAAVEDLGGSVEVRSEPGVGTRFTLILPLTLGVLRCLVARVGDERFAVPVPGVVESLSLRHAEVHALAGAPVVVRHGVSVPLLDLAAALGVPGSGAPRAALVVRHSSTVVAWAVDRLEGEAELVVKDLGSFLGRVPYVTGATIDADGSVVCLLDLRELAERAVGLAPVAAAPAPVAPAGPPARVLVVEDSVGVRELERVILEGAGYQVETAVDGLDGASRLRAAPADLVLSDVEMPGMDGYELTRTIRRTRGWENVPVVIMTSRGEADARAAGLAAGCSAYLLKNEFDQDSLVATVKRLVGR